MNNLRSVLHIRGESGGTEIGWSSLSEYAKCPLRWALAELIPHPRGGEGVKSRPGRALIVGTLVHAWLAGWYSSDPEGGNYNEDAGFAALDLAKAEYTEEDLFQTNASNRATPLTEAIDLCRRYHAECKIDGPDPDYERFHIAFADGVPLIEQYFRVDLGYEGYYFSTRVDTIGWACNDLPTTTTPGTIVIPEHKTCDVGQKEGRILDLSLSGQLTGEMWAVKGGQMWPSQVRLDHSGKIQPVLNMILKRATAKDGGLGRKWVEPEREPGDLEKFRLDVVRRLKRMDADVAEWQDLVRSGVPPLTAALLVFDGHPPREVCAGQGFKCFAYEMCANRKYAANWLIGTEPRFPPPGEETDGLATA